MRDLFLLLSLLSDHYLCSRIPADGYVLRFTIVLNFYFATNYVLHQQRQFMIIKEHRGIRLSSDANEEKEDDTFEWTRDYLCDAYVCVFHINAYKLSKLIIKVRRMVNLCNT